MVVRDRKIQTDCKQSLRIGKIRALNGCTGRLFRAATRHNHKNSDIKRSLKKDAFGITSLRENGILKTDTVEKANICNKQFQSAFTRETDSEIPSKGTSPFTAMGPQTVKWA